MEVGERGLGLLCDKVVERERVRVAVTLCDTVVGERGLGLLVDTEVGKRVRDAVSADLYEVAEVVHQSRRQVDNELVDAS